MSLSLSLYLLRGRSFGKHRNVVAVATRNESFEDHPLVCDVIWPVLKHGSVLGCLDYSFYLVVVFVEMMLVIVEVMATMVLERCTG